MAKSNTMSQNEQHTADLLTRIATQEKLIKKLTKENFALAAGQCIVPGGLLGDDHGHTYCSLKDRYQG